MSCHYPLLFEPVYRDYLWGGDGIAQNYPDRAITGRVAESWEISDREDGMSVIANGSLQGTSLRDLLAEHRDAIMGPAAARTAFPLLVKLLDVREAPSIQVHPDDESARRLGAEAKSEAWIFLEAADDARIYGGLKPGMDEARLRAALTTGRIEAVVETQPVHAGDVVAVPGGLVHSCASGTLILEIQQNSNTTYRIYDWDRRDDQGRSRALHIEEAIDVIHWDAQPQISRRSEIQANLPPGTFRERVRTPHFAIEVAQIVDEMTCTHARPGCSILFGIDGDVRVSTAEYEERIPAGRAVLVPAAISTWQLRALDGPVNVIQSAP